MALPQPALTLTPEFRSRQLRDFLLLVVGATAIGNSSALYRFAETAPAAAAFWRMAFALPVLAAWAMLERREGDPVRPHPVVIAAGIFAGFSFAIDLTLSNIALGLTTMTSFIILVHLAPVVVVIIAWFWFREKPTAAILAALAMAIIGAALLVQSGRAAPPPATRSSATSPRSPPPSAMPASSWRRRRRAPSPAPASSASSRRAPAASSACSSSCSRARASGPPPPMAS